MEANVRIALYKPHRSELNVDANLKVDACRRVLEKPKSYRSTLNLDNDVPNDKRLSSHTEIVNIQNKCCRVNKFPGF